MPRFAEENPYSFWQAAGDFERKNGRACTELQIALPGSLRLSSGTSSPVSGTGPDGRAFRRERYEAYQRERAPAVVTSKSRFPRRSRNRAIKIDRGFGLSR